MQNIPVILSVFAAAAAIVVVLFWRLKPLPAGDVEALNKRVLEEAEKARTLQTKLDEMQDTWRVAEATAAAAKATADAANESVGRADRREKEAVLGLTHWQSKYTDIEPLLATANAQKVAAEAAKIESVRLYDDLMTRHNHLQAQFGEFKPAVAKATAEKEAAETAWKNLEQQLDAVSQKNDTLLVDLTTAVERAATAEKDSTNAREYIQTMNLVIETLTVDRDEAKRDLVKAVAKQQSDENATRQFEVISQAVLKETLADAKRGVAELALSIQQSGKTELEKHVSAVAHTLEPLQNKLAAYDAAVESLKRGSQENYGSLKEQINKLQETERSLHDQARALTNALSSSPKVKGNYGEMILKQLVEFVGMQEKYHFEPQASRDTDEGRKIPDLVVSLPGGQRVLVDAKAVMSACVEAHQTQNDEHRAILLKKHCDNVRSRVIDLSSKNYFEDHANAVEAVVLFLPAENLYAAALENDPELTEFAMKRNIIICGPNSLMMLLKVANQLWRRDSIEEEAQKIKECGDGIYKAACLFLERYSRLGTKIQQLEEAYNEAAGTLNGNLIPKGRSMSRLTAVASSKEVEEIAVLKEDVRPFSSPEAKRMLTATNRLPGLILGEFETAELVFATGEEK